MYTDKCRGRCYGELWASLMHRELEQWVDDLLHPQMELTLGTSTDDAVSPPPDEDWVHIKPVPQSISNMQQIIPEWVPTELDEPQMATNEQGPPQQPTEQDGAPSSSQSDGGHPGTNDSEVLREMERESEGEQEPMGGNEQGEAGATSVSSEHGETGVTSLSSAQGEAGASSATAAGKLTWDSLGRAKKQFNYDILPKVVFILALMEKICDQYMFICCSR